MARLNFPSCNAVRSPVSQSLPTSFTVAFAFCGTAASLEAKVIRFTSCGVKVSGPAVSARCHTSSLFPNPVSLPWSCEPSVSSSTESPAGSGAGFAPFFAASRVRTMRPFTICTPSASSDAPLSEMSRPLENSISSARVCSTGIVSAASKMVGMSAAAQILILFLILIIF